VGEEKVRKKKKGNAEEDFKKIAKRLQNRQKRALGRVGGAAKRSPGESRGLEGEKGGET